MMNYMNSENTFMCSNVCKPKQKVSEDLQLRQRMNNTGPEVGKHKDIILLT